MPSSTLRSRPGLPTLALRLLGVAVIGWAASAFYTLRLNPEVAHFAYTHRVKHAWAEKLTREHGAKIVVFGGSSCEFAFDGERLLEKHGLPVANLGRGAGMGAAVLTEAALAETRPGDTLIVALEPALLTSRLELTSLGVQFSFVAGHPEWVIRPAFGPERYPWASALLALRPGGYHTFTLLGKLVSGQRLYRYLPSDLRPSGWLQTSVRLPIDGPPWHGVHLSPDGRALLRGLRAECEARGLRVAYSLLWGYTPPDKVSAFQRENAQFLLEVAEFLPALRDPRLGAYSVLEHFADTAIHLNKEGAALQCDEFADQLKHWRVWKPEELRKLSAN
jgi:hypothetical protein